MLQILDMNKTPVLGLARYTDYSVTSSLTFSDKTLKFKALIEDVEGIVLNEGYILTKEDRYVIKEVNPSFNGHNVEIVAQLDLESLEGKAWPKFTAADQTISAILSLAFVGTGWTVGTCVDLNGQTIDKLRSMSLSNCSSLDILTEALNVFRCECSIDSLNQVVNIYEELGEYRGTYFTNDLNLKKLDVRQTSYDFYTEIEPYGKAYRDEDSGSESSSGPRMTSLTIGQYDFFEMSGNIISGAGTNRIQYEIAPYIFETINTRDRISVKSASETDEIRIWRPAAGSETVAQELENDDEIRWYYTGYSGGSLSQNTLRIEITDAASGVTAWYELTVLCDPDCPGLSSLSIGENTTALKPDQSIYDQASVFIPQRAVELNGQTYGGVGKKFYTFLFNYDLYTYNARNRLTFSASPSGATVTATVNGNTTGNDNYLTWRSGENTVIISVGNPGKGYYNRVYKITVHYVSVEEFRAIEEQEKAEEEAASETPPLTIKDIDGDDIVHDVVSDRHYITNYQYSTKAKRYIWNAGSYTDAAALAEDARAKLNDMSKPYLAYSADVVDLANVSSEYSVLAYSLGDKVMLIDATTGTRTMQRITEITEYEDEPERNTCTLANAILTFEELQQKWRTTANQVDSMASGTGSISAGSIRGLATEVNNLFVNGKLTAVEAEIGTLYANVGYFEQLYAQELTAQNATIDNLRVTYLEGDTAKLNVLIADTANITHLLANDIEADSVTTIVLTSHNTTVENSFVDTILATNAIVRNLTAGKINTNDITISDTTGRIVLSGATQQFKDSNGNVRLQMGEDAKGNFTFVLYDETGNGILLDSTGIHNSSMIDSGLIKDSHVANDAGIMASKLDIDSLFTEINNSTKTIKSNRIWFDDQGQSLNQLYTRMSESVSDAVDIAGNASTTAQNASSIAQSALDALSGISTLDAISAVLSNDSHVVHTESDGSGGNYSGCSTKVDVYLGDTGISSQARITASPSAGVVGSWNNSSRTYSVTNMTGDSGYVDFSISYEDALLTKRFSISKAKDGQVGKSYRVEPSVSVMTIKEDTKELTPSTVTFSAYINEDNILFPYNGRFTISESSDGSKWVDVYSSSADEASVVYTPRSWSTYRQRYIRATLANSSGNVLDIQTVLILVSAEGLSESINELSDTQQKFVTETYKTDVANFQDSIDQFKRSLLSTTTELSGVSNGTYVWQPSYSYNDTEVTLTARLYFKGLDITQEFPASRYSWLLKTESGESSLGTGYTKTFARERCGFGASVIATFQTEQNTADGEEATVGPAFVDQSFAV